MWSQISIHAKFYFKLIRKKAWLQQYSTLKFIKFGLTYVKNVVAFLKTFLKNREVPYVKPMSHSYLKNCLKDVCI